MNESDKVTMPVSTTTGTSDTCKAVSNEKTGGVDTSENILAPTGKKGCRWLFVTHEEIIPHELIAAWNEVTIGTNAVLKIEPGILHIQCRNLEKAKKLVGKLVN